MVSDRQVRRLMSLLQQEQSLQVPADTARLSCHLHALDPLSASPETRRCSTGC